MPKPKSQAVDTGPGWIERLLHEALFATALGLSVFLLVALFSYSPGDPGWSSSGDGGRIHNLIGVTGAWIADVLLSLLGYVAYLVPALVFALGLNAYRSLRNPLTARIPAAMRGVAAIVTVACTAALFAQHVGASPNWVPQGSGGISGQMLADTLVGVLSTVGASLLLLTLLAASLPIALTFSWLMLFDRVGDVLLNGWQSWRRRRSEAAAARDKARDSEKLAVARREVSLPPPPLANVARPVAPAESSPSLQREMKKRRKAPNAAAETQLSLPITEEAGVEVPPFTGDPLPPLSMLDAPRPSVQGFSEVDLERISRDLEQHLSDFGVTATVVAAQPGPVVTRFELQPAPGVKGSQVTNLAKDLARALSVASVRVIEVVEGKSVIGLEIPNHHRDVVQLSEILSGPGYQNSASPVTLALGKDIAGHPVVIDLAKMPHLMVAGTTGAGKSVAINVMILSILYRATADQVRLILIDPKMLELSVYEGIPHLLTPVVTDMKDAANALRWCVGEMERRYRLMTQIGVRNLAGLNRKIADAVAAGKPLIDPLAPKSDLFEDGDAPEPVYLESVPAIVVIIDELADMMMVVGKKVEELIARIAQKARAAGIHLIVATQRPSVDVITGLIKANIPSRVAFQVASRVDSRTILDEMGAETLLGHGDMLYRPVGSSRINRVHGAFVDDHEVHKVAAYLRQVGEPDYIEAVVSGEPDAGTGAETEDAEKDPLYDQAVALVIETGKASTSWVQRRLKIGYNRAARMIEQMEASGVVGPSGPGGNREILVPGAGER
ncbi:MAG: DNA translocase FtsK 4TM domain-containing protein [Pseudomonadota bacterium]|nr:DNA translocase FtsK 4TM domain-containing protein [Pseudomonadota bacterium]